LRLVFKLWLTQEEKAFGEGPCELLERIRSSGSLKKAAEEMGMSYSKAWTVIRRAEKQLGVTLLLRKAGGTEGGGSLLTAEAHDLITRYRQFCSEAGDALLILYKKHFTGFFD
jgi:molybdate transport system regulatory protein